MSFYLANPTWRAFNRLRHFCEEAKCPDRALLARCLGRIRLKVTWRALGGLIRSEARTLIAFRTFRFSTFLTVESDRANFYPKLVKGSRLIFSLHLFHILGAYHAVSAQLRRRVVAIVAYHSIFNCALRAIIAEQAWLHVQVRKKILWINFLCHIRLADVASRALYELCDTMLRFIVANKADRTCLLNV